MTWTDAFQLFTPAELSRRRAKLLARIRPRFQIVEEEFRFGPLRIGFTRVADPDVVLDEIVAEEDRRERATGMRREGDELHLPYWAELWDSSIGMGEFLVRRGVAGVGRKTNSVAPRPTAHAPRSVLDLGCGMGLAGTVAAAMGHQVVLADLEPEALLFAQLNTLPYARRARTRRLNWQTDRLDERFDLILGADVLYERAQWDYLEPFWRAHLNDGGAVLLGEPGRQTGDLFTDWITHRGWTLEQFEQPVATRARPIRLFQLTR